MHARMGVRGRTLDGDQVDMQFACLPVAAVMTLVMVVVVMVVVTVVAMVVVHIDPGEF